MYEPYPAIDGEPRDPVTAILAAVRAVLSARPHVVGARAPYVVDVIVDHFSALKLHLCWDASALVFPCGSIPMPDARACCDVQVVWSKAEGEVVEVRRRPCVD